MVKIRPVCFRIHLPLTNWPPVGSNGNLVLSAIDHFSYDRCDQKKSPNVFKSCPKMISLEKLKILTPLQKLPKNVGDLGKLIVAKGFEKLSKVQ